MTRTSSYKLVFFSLCSRLGKQWYYYYFHYYYYYYYYYCHHYYYYFSLKGIVYFIMIKKIRYVISFFFFFYNELTLIWHLTTHPSLFKGWVSLGQPTRPRVLLGLVASNEYICINACLNLPQRHILAWQPRDDSCPRAVFKMEAFSNVPIVVTWTFVRNRMLPQIKQQQLEPYCSWYYYIFFYFRVLF